MSAIPNYKFPQQLNAQSLAELLSKAHLTFEPISREVLSKVLSSPELEQELEQRTLLALFNIRFLALAHLPQAFETLIKLLNSEKPEVARRSATTVLELSGLSAKTQPQPSVQPDTHKKPLPPSKALAKTLSHIPFDEAQKKRFRANPILAALSPDSFLNDEQKNLYDSFNLGLPRPLTNQSQSPATTSPGPNTSPKQSKRSTP